MIVISELGVLLLRDFANKLTESFDNLKFQQNLLNEIETRNNIRYGPGADKIRAVLESMEEACISGTTAIDLLSYSVNELADCYEIVLNQKIVNNEAVQRTKVDTDLGARDLRGVFQGLEKTKQPIQDMTIQGVEYTIFDHPFEAFDMQDIIINQGSNSPNGEVNTCGCCAAGTLINKTGTKFTEYDMVSFGRENGLCTDEGMTNAKSWVDFLSGMGGIKASVTSGESLEKLAQKVETGYGVVLGVNAGVLYNDASLWREGHAVVLTSVVREKQTGKIEKYIIIDSNGHDASSAVLEIDAKTMKKAFGVWNSGKTSVTTDCIIW